MSSFTSPLIVTPLDCGRRWRLYEPFQYHIGEMESGIKVLVPVGFTTDFASVPWVFWQLIPYWGKYGKAAVVHDYLYQAKLIIVKKDGLSFIGRPSRKYADEIFYEAMLVGGTARWKARLMYLGVRWFGWLAWRRT